MAGVCEWGEFDGIGDLHVGGMWCRLQNVTRGCVSTAKDAKNAEVHKIPFVSRR